jgi:hypothetical protein
MTDSAIYPCTALSANYGATDKSESVAQIVVRIEDGPMKGQRVTYEEEVNARSAKYVGWACTAVGWKGRNLETLKADAAEWIAATGGATTVEIKDIVTRKGTPDEGVWHKPTAIGKGAAKPLKAAAKEATKDANEMMRAAMGGGGYDPAPPGEPNEDIPFIYSTACEPSPIAKVLK